MADKIEGACGEAYGGIKSKWSSTVSEFVDVVPLMISAMSFIGTFRIHTSFGQQRFHSDMSVSQSKATSISLSLSLR